MTVSVAQSVCYSSSSRLFFLPTLGVKTAVNNDVWSDSNRQRHRSDPGQARQDAPAFGNHPPRCSLANSNRPSTPQRMLDTTEHSLRPHCAVLPSLIGVQRTPALDGGPQIAQRRIALRCTAPKACEMAAWVGGFKGLFMTDPIQSTSTDGQGDLQLIPWLGSHPRSRSRSPLAQRPS